MRPCTRVGVDVTWRCQWSCRHCFYLRNDSFHKPIDVPLEAITEKVDRAKSGGLDHVVMVGYGEPSLWPHTPALIDYAHSKNMAVSMITNGATGLDKFKGYFSQGLDHLHISSHGLNGTLEDVTGNAGAFKRQAELKEWLASERLPFRTNVTLQAANYEELPELATYEVSRGVYHFVFLGFLPHYEWKGHLNEVAVHPAKLRPYIEEAADVLLDSKTLFTIRYQPMCQLSPRLWPYVVNARFVYFDPWEWNYELQVKDVEDLWEASVRLGDSASAGSRCHGCALQAHCGGWNGRMAIAFRDSIKPVSREEVPEEFATLLNVRGGLHDRNPANAHSGTIRVFTPDH